MLMHKILQNHLLCAFVANFKFDSNFALYPEIFCDENLAIRKVFAFCDSGSAHIRFASGTTSLTFCGLKLSWQLSLLWFLMWRSSITCWVAIHILSWGGGRGRGFLTSFSESRWHLSKVSQLLDKLFTQKKVNHR